MGKDTRERILTAALEQSGRRTNALRALLAKQGFEGKALRTLSFNVIANYKIKRLEN